MPITIERADHPGGVVQLKLAPRTPHPGPFEVEPADSILIERAAERELAAGNARLVFDLEGAGHVYSTALWAIVGAARAAHDRAGRAVLVTRSPYVASVLALSSAGDAIQHRSELAAGLAACAA